MAARKSAARKRAAPDATTLERPPEREATVKNPILVRERAILPPGTASIEGLKRTFKP